MTSTDSGQAAARLIDSFIDAPPRQREAEYQRLVASVWDDGTLKELALPAAREIVDRLNSVDDEVKGHLAILLGLLAEAEYPKAEYPKAEYPKAEDPEAEHPAAGGEVTSA